MSQFLYFFTIPGNQDLLKEEIRLFHPQLSLAFSRPGFCTFKNIGKELSWEKITKLEFIYALNWGIFIKKATLKEVLRMRNTVAHHISALNDISPVLESGGAESYPITDFVQTGEKEYFVGKRVCDQYQSTFRRRYHLEKKVISRAYFKAADGFSLLNINSPKYIIELGCSPGGITQYLLENGNKVVGVDPGEMDPHVMNDAKFSQLKVKIQEFNHYDSFEMLVSDMNLHPEMVLKYVLKLCSKMSSIKEIFITLKTNKLAEVKKIPQHRQLLLNFGFKEVHFFQLPYHGREFQAYAKL